MIRQLLILIFTASMLVASIGDITKFSGNAVIIRDSIELKAAVGSQIEESDLIKTFGESKLQLRFSDNTIVTLGQNSEFSIEEYFFDEDVNSRSKFKLTKGALNAITGAISKVAPNNFKLKLRTSSIGIRGTEFMGKITDLGDTVACVKGIIAVGSLELDIEPVIVKEGMITVIRMGEAPTPPRKYSPKEINILSNASGTDDASSTEETAKDSTEETGASDESLETAVTESAEEAVQTVVLPDETKPVEELATHAEESTKQLMSDSFSGTMDGWFTYLGASAFEKSTYPEHVSLKTGTVQNATVKLDALETDTYNNDNVFFSFDAMVEKKEDYSYTTWGEWDSRTHNPPHANPEGSFFWVAGATTQTVDLPKAGYGNYEGVLLGQSYDSDSGTIKDLVGTNTFTVDFENKSFSSTFSLEDTNGNAFPSISGSGSFIDHYGKGALSGSMSGGSWSGSLKGTFNGPRGEELGGNWSISAGSYDSAAGVFAAHTTN